MENKEQNQDVVKYPNPTPDDLLRPEFDLVWDVIKHWDISRMDSAHAGLYAGANGNDVMAILKALQPRIAELEELNQELVEALEEVRWCLEDRANETSGGALVRSALMPKKVKEALQRHANLKKEGI